MLTIFQQIILGLVQGVTEWIPISSSAALVFMLSNLFGETNTSNIISTTLFFHLGTFFAALIYFRKDVSELTKKIFHYKYADEKSKKTIKFLFLSTIISGILGAILLKLFLGSEEFSTVSAKTISIALGGFLLFTGVIQLKIRRGGLKEERNIENSDSVILGFVQGLSVIPGISRSGITISTLLLRKFDDTTALKLSFLMSLPIVFAGNIILNFTDFTFTSTAIYGFLASFIFGLATIHVLMKISRKINFGWFVLLFAALMILSVFI